MAPTFDRPNFDRLTSSLCRSSGPLQRPPEDSIEVLQAGVRRVSQMVGVPLRVDPERTVTGWASAGWSEGMASLAWLMEQRLLQLGSFENSPKHQQECLRLRALVAMIWWQGERPEALASWEIGDAEALCRRHDVWLESFGEKAQDLPVLLVAGPRRAICDWLEAARISTGSVLRRISPSGKVACGALSLVGLRSILATLVADALEVGLVNASFAMNFSIEKPVHPLGMSVGDAEVFSSHADIFRGAGLVSDGRPWVQEIAT